MTPAEKLQELLPKYYDGQRVRIYNTACNITHSNYVLFEEIRQWLNIDQAPPYFLQELREDIEQHNFMLDPEEPEEQKWRVEWKELISGN